MSHADCNLLFGILALQNGLIDQAGLIAAFQAWSQDRFRPLSQVLHNRGAERYTVVEGKTPEIAAEQARTLLKSIDASNPVGLRDRAVLAVLIHTAARVGAVAELTVKNLVHDGTKYDASNPVGLRDRAMLAVLIYTAARVGAVAELTVKNLVHDGSKGSRGAKKSGLVVDWEKCHSTHLRVATTQLPRNYT